MPAHTQDWMNPPIVATRRFNRLGKEVSMMLGVVSSAITLVSNKQIHHSKKKNVTSRYSSRYWYHNTVHEASVHGGTLS